jgi:hypothetical protein
VAESPSAQLARFLAKYSPEVRSLAKDALARMRALTPGAIEFVYDNYNALVIGFGPTERPSDAILSIALYPRWVNLYFLDGAMLDDPTGALRGGGARVRNVRLSSAADLDAPAVRVLIAQALAIADPPLNRHQPRKTIVRVVSAKQRSRRPSNRPASSDTASPRRRRSAPRPRDRSAR